jgi:ribosomal protein S18 acetylase RimI-like enzyme
MSERVRAGRSEDVAGVVEAHLSAFPGYFLSLLGPRFLRSFYAAFLTDREGILLVTDDPAGRVQGFLAGARDPAGYFARLKFRSAVALGLAALPALLRHPRRTAERLLAALVYRGERPDGLPGHWLLSSLGVRADAAGRGLGAALVERFCDDARGAGARGIYLVTDGEDNAAALRFYGRIGFVEHSAWVRRDGRRLLLLKRSLSE